jgi:hypothetical protein
MERIIRRAITSSVEKIKLKRIGFNSSGTLSLIFGKDYELKETIIDPEETIINLNKDELNMLVDFIDKIRPEWNPK